MTRQLFTYAGWSAYMSATATIITFASAILFFSLGQPFGTINDISSVFQVIFMLPLALVLYGTPAGRDLRDAVHLPFQIQQEQELPPPHARSAVQPSSVVI
jgi:hypothetical protein